MDFSACSRTALTVASELAAQTDVALTVVHIWEQPLYDGGNVDETARVVADWVASATTTGAKRVHSQVISGVPWIEIVRMLDDDRTFELVVIGTHGRTGLKHALVGSAAENVVRHAPRAVLVAR